MELVKSKPGVEIFQANSQYELFKQLIQDLPEICSITDMVPSMDPNTGQISNKLVLLSLANKDKVQQECILGSVHTTDNLDVSLDINLTIASEDRSESATVKLADVIRIPIYTRSGMKINGQRLLFTNESTMAKGWQVELKKSDKSDSNPECFYTFRPERGTTLIIDTDRQGQRKKYVLKNKKNGVKVTLLNVLRAYTGLDRDVIVDMVSCGVGDISDIIPNLSSLGEKAYEEYSSIDACKRSLIALFSPYNITSKNVDADFKQYVLNTNRFILSETSYKRVQRFFSFTTRCLNTTLSESVRLPNGNILEEGTHLTAELLNEIDKTDLQELHVSLNGITFRVLKKSVTRRLGLEHILNLANILCCEKLGLSINRDIDMLENKRILNAYTTLHDFIVNSLYHLLDEIAGTLKSGTKLSIDRSFKKLVHADFAEYFSNPATQIPSIGSITYRNSVSSISPEFKITSGAKEITYAARDVRESNIGILDAQISPESKKSGITQHIGSTTFSNKNGEFCNYFYKVEDGAITENLYILTISEMFDKCIAVQHWGGSAKTVMCLQYGNITQHPIKDVDFVYILDASISSRWALIGPCHENNKSRRTLMSSNQADQYSPILGAERHQVTSGISSTYTEHLIRCSEIVEKLCARNNVAFNQSLCEAGITLISHTVGTEIAQYSFKSNDSRLVKEVLITVDHIATIAQLVWTFKLNTSLRDELKWYGDEIVLAPMDVITETATISPHSEMQSMNGINLNSFTDAIVEKDLGMGREIEIAVCSWKGFCYEDGGVMSQSLAESLHLAHLVSHKIEIELSDIDVPQNYSYNRNLQSNGLPIIDKYYYDNEVIFTYVRTPRQSRPDQIIQASYKEIRVKEGQAGYIQSAEIKMHKGKRYAIITIGDIKTTNVGDKYTGHHGDKLSIVRILPDSEMPFHPETGRPVDFCVNPIGIPPRMNLGKPMEMALSEFRKFRTLNNEVLVIAPYSPVTKVISNLEIDKKYTGYQILYDPVALAPFENPIEVNQEYILKLDHSVDKKMSTIASPTQINAKTKQPQKSKLNPGGQRISELASSAIFGNGAYALHQYFFSLASDDLLGRSIMEKEIMENGESHSVGRNNTYKVQQAYLNMAGFYLNGDTNSGISISFMTNNEIRNMADRLNITDDVSFLLYNPVSKTKQFGKKQKERFYYVDCNSVEWVNPACISDYNSSLFPVRSGKDLGFLSGDRVKALLHGNIAVDVHLVEEANYPIIEIVPVGTPNSKTGGIALLDIFKNYTNEQWCLSNQAIINTLTSKSRSARKDAELIDRATQNIEILKGMEPLENYVLNNLLLIPQDYRFSAPELNQTDCVNTMLGVLLRQLKSLNDSKVFSNSNNAVAQKAYTNKYNNFYLELYLICTASEFKEGRFKDNPGIKPIMALIGDKEIGISRSAISSKIVANSGRSVIVGVPSCNLGDYRVPVQMAYTMYQYYIVYWLKNDERLPEWVRSRDNSKLLTLINDLKDYNLGKIARDYAISYKDAKELYEIVYEVVDDNLLDCCDMLTREPALHNTSTQGSRPRLWRNRAIGIPTEVCKAYNADFDGDQMAVNAPQTEEAREDLKQHMRPEAILVDSSTGEATFSLEQDVVLGFYSVTYTQPDPNKPDIKVYTENDLDSLKEDIKYRCISSTETVLYNDELTTAGRLFVACNLPLGKGFDSNGKLTYNKTIDKSVVRSIQESYRDETPEVQVQVISMLKRLGYACQDCNNTSFSIADLLKIEMDDVFKSKKDSLRNDLNDKMLSVDIRQSLGLFRDATVVKQQDYSKYSKSILKTAEEYCPEGSNLSRLWKSGAKGTSAILMEAVGGGGYVKNLLEQFTPHPIQNSLINGYSCLDTFWSGYESRHSTVSTVLRTADSGELTRLYSLTMDGEIIDTEDCGSQPVKHLLKYDLVTSYITGADSNNYADNMVGKVLKEGTAAYELVGNKPCDMTSLDYFVEKHIPILEAEDGTTILLKYQLSDMSRKQMKTHYGYDIDEQGNPITDKEVLLDDDILDKYESLDLPYIYARTTWSCKCTQGICAKCYGLSIRGNFLEPVGRAVGILLAEGKGQTTAQLAMDVKHTKGDSASQTAIVDRLKSNVMLSKTFNPNIHAYYAPEDTQYIVVDQGDFTSNIYISGEDRPIARNIDQNRILIGEEQLVHKGQKVFDGYNCYGLLSKIIPLDNLRLTLMWDYFFLYSSNNINLHPKHFELLVHAQTRMAKVTSSGADEIMMGSLIDYNKAKDLANNGVPIEFEAVAGGHLDNCFSTGWFKALMSREALASVTKASRFKLRDPLTGIFSNLAIGRSGPSDTVYVAVGPKERMLQKKTESRHTTVEKERPEDKKMTDKNTLVKTNVFGEVTPKKSPGISLTALMSGTVNEVNSSKQDATDTKTTKTSFFSSK